MQTVTIWPRNDSHSRAPGLDQTDLITYPFKKPDYSFYNINKMVTYRKLWQHRGIYGRKHSADVLIEAVLAISNKVPQSCARAACAAPPLFIIRTFNHVEKMQSVAINIHAMYHILCIHAIPILITTFNMETSFRMFLVIQDIERPDIHTTSWKCKLLSN